MHSKKIYLWYRYTVLIMFIIRALGLARPLDIWWIICNFFIEPHKHLLSWRNIILIFVNHLYIWPWDGRCDSILHLTPWQTQFIDFGNIFQMCWTESHYQLTKGGTRDKNILNILERGSEGNKDPGIRRTNKYI